jgi:hypothetical protein
MRAVVTRTASLDVTRCQLVADPAGQPKADLLLAGGGAFPDGFQKQLVVAGSQAKISERVESIRAARRGDIVAALLDRVAVSRQPGILRPDTEMAVGWPLPGEVVGIHDRG